MQRAHCEVIEVDHMRLKQILIEAQAYSRIYASRREIT